MRNYISIFYIFYIWFQDEKLCEDDEFQWEYFTQEEEEENKVGFLYNEIVGTKRDYRDVIVRDSPFIELQVRFRPFN